MKAQAGQEIPKLSLLSGFFFNLIYVIPHVLEGLFIRRPLFVRLTTLLNTDAMAIRLLWRARRKHGGVLQTRVIFKKSVLLLDEDSIRHVLENSPQKYGPSDKKKEGMSLFQPDSLTISVGPEWELRREFNVAVLHDGFGPEFAGAIRYETRCMQQTAQRQLDWPAFEQLFERIMSQLIFGDSSPKTRDISDSHRQMLKKANSSRRSGKFDSFYEHLRMWLKNPRETTLIERCRRIPSSEATKVEYQISHWMFAIRDSVAANTVRALALIVSHPEIERNVRNELSSGNLIYLDACVEEAMRLWPTTPFIGRKASEDDVVSGFAIDKEMQVLIVNTFNHRDEKAYPLANRFCPDQWRKRGSSYQFNHFSNGPQKCAGAYMAVYIAGLVIATLLSHARYTLKRPRLNAAEPVPAMFNHFRARFIPVD